MTPLHDRPRERLLQLGGDALSTGELIALVLGTGTAGRPATEIARALLEQSGDLLALSRADARELAATPGVGLARACRLVAAFQLGRRVMTPPLTGAVLAGPADVFHHLRGRVRGLEQELFFVIAVDARNAITCEIEIARGSLTAVDVHPREVFRPLVRQAAAAAVVAHNHPSGDSTPSEADVALTRRLRQAGALIGIPILDHVVIGSDDYTSIGELLAADAFEEDPEPWELP
ncbi:MAG TPA: DNA repair protein RadC [Kofleriaceae bacterium]|nr:DNA repair protein RadC [Kofleriaceae bacterium]